MPNTAIHSVAIVGGTHGNEKTGVFTIKKMRRYWQEQWQRWPSINVKTFFGNPKAIEANKRYIDKDLNRCFNQETLNDVATASYELERARTLNRLLGPKGAAATDFIMDLHTSTACMGINIVLTKKDAFHTQLARYLSLQLPNVVITSEENLMQDHHFLASIASRNVLIEVGPVAQGLLHDEILQKTENVVVALLDFLEQYNNDCLPLLEDSIEAFEYISHVQYPLDESGDFAGVIHQDLQSKDFTEIRPGAPIFRLFNGNTVYFEESRPLYVSFINEAAYYDKKIAFCLLEKITL
ncbi:MAG: aspartoacylase [Pseudomonadota bacterium]